MDYSPYKRAKVVSSPYSISKFFPIFIFVGCLIIGFLLFWAAKSFFFTEKGTSVLSTFTAGESIAEIQRESGEWTALESSGIVSEGEKVRLVSNEGGTVYLKNGSKVVLGDAAVIFLEEMRQTDSGMIFGDVYRENGSLLYTGNSGIDEEEKLKIWVSENVYIPADTSTFFIMDNTVHHISGKTVSVIRTDEDGKILNQEQIGIGQSINTTTFITEPTPENIKSLPLVSGVSNPNGADPLVTPNAAIGSPVVESPKSGTLVTSDIQKIEGTAPLSTETIIISFENGDNKENLSFKAELSESGKETIWSYNVSSTYDTLLKGTNSYTIYAVDTNGERSAPTLLLLKYGVPGDETTDEDTDTDDNSDDDTASSRKLAITSPNGGENGTVETSTITLSGTAPTNAAYIRVTNKTTNTPSYTLQKFSKGDASWNYFTSALPANSYTYLVEALSSSKTVLETDTIILTVTDENGAKTNTPSPSPKPTETTTTSTSPTSTPVLSPKLTPTPAIQSSTLEVGR